MSKHWARVAKLVATQGVKGRFVARSCDGLPFLLEKGLKVHFVPPSLDAPRSATVSDSTHTGGSDWLVSFKGVRGLDAAEILVGSYCVVSRADLPEGFDAGAEHAAEFIVGCTIVDEVAGEVGVVEEVREMPTQHLIVARNAAGDEALIPLVDEFLVDFDEEAGVVYMDLPEGLLDLSGAGE